MDDFSETEQLQHEIRQTLKVLRWSQPNFAAEYEIEKADYDVDEDEIKKAVERFKSYLKRKNTRPDRLRPYLEFLKSSDKFKKCPSESLRAIRPHQGFITDYQNILDDEDNSTHKKVLELAAAYALSIGDAWDFHVVTISEKEFDYQYIVIWEGDIGRNGGTGTYGPAMCEVSGWDMKRLSVEPADGVFDVGVRFLSDVIGYKNNQLIVIGLDRDEDNWAVNYAPMAYRLALEKDFAGKWMTVDREFIGMVDDEDRYCKVLQRLMKTLGV